MDDQDGNAIEDTEITLDGEFHAMTDAEGMATVDTTNGKVYIETGIKELSVAVLNVTGRLMYNGIIQNTRHQINVEPYPSGMYVIRLKQDGRIRNHKLLVR